MTKEKTLTDWFVHAAHGSRRWPGLCGLALALLPLASCGSRPTSNVGTGASALTCSDSTLSWTPENLQDGHVCAGPWLYHPFLGPCYANAPNPACGTIGFQQVDCSTYPRCQDASFGVTQVTLVNLTQSVNGFFCFPTKSCAPILPGSPLAMQLQQQCQSSAQAQLASVASTAPPGVLSATGTLTLGTNANCHIVVRDAVNNFGHGPVCGALDVRQCDDPNQPIFAACRMPDNGIDPDPAACGIDDNTILYSAPGLPGEDVSNPLSCLTCDDLPAGTSDEVQAKYNCLQNVRNTADSLPVDTLALNLQLESRLELLLELKGDLLSEAQREQIRPLYTFQSDAGFECDGGVEFAAPPTADSCDSGSLIGINGQFNFCKRLTQPHVSNDSALANAGKCADIALSLAALSEDCARSQYIAGYLQVVVPVLQKGLAASIADGADRRSAIQDRLTLISRVYSDMSVLGLADMATPIGQVTGALWKGLYDPEVDKVRGSAARLREVFDSEFAVDREVLDAAFAPRNSTNGCAHSVTTEGEALDPSCDPCVAFICANSNPPVTGVDMLPDAFCCQASWDGFCVSHEASAHFCSALMPSQWLPLPTPPLLSVVGDALTALSNRLDDVSLVHDLGCRFKSDAAGVSACAAPGLATSTSTLMQVLAALPDAAALRAALDAAGTKLDPQWRPVFQAIADHHQGLELAVLAATGGTTYDPALLGSGTANTSVPYARALSGLIATVQSRASRYAATGLFQAQADLLLGGLQDSRFNTIQGDLNAKISLLTAGVTQYNAGQNDLVAALVAAADGTKADDLLQNQLATSQQQLDDLVGQVEGLRIANEGDEGRFGDFMTAFQAANLGTGADPNALMSTGSTDRLTIAGNAARFTAGADDSLAALGVQQGSSPWTLAANAGDVVNFQVSGLYDPSCAVRNALAPNGQPYAVAAGSLIGPDGYMLREDNGSYSATSNSDMHATEKFASLTASVKACAGFSINRFASVEACITAELGEKKSHTTTSGTAGGDETRQTASFSVGLRVPRTTPFSDAPAGALLLVQVPRGQTDRASIIDVTVLREPATSIFVAADADLYLVVNDESGCQDTPDALQVTVTQMVPQAIMAKKLGIAMQSVHETLRQRAQQAAQRGVLTPSEISSMRDEANAAVSVTCHCNFATFPAPLHEFFNVWVNKELVAIERQVATIKAQQDLDIIAIGMDGLNKELTSELSKRHAQALLPAWSMRNLDADALRDTLHPLLHSLTEEFFPFLLLRYPSALIHGADAQNRMNALVANDWTTPTVDLADGVVKLANALMTEASSSVNDNPPSKESDVLILNFVRPGQEKAFGSVWHLASPERAGAAWSQIDERGVHAASFSVQSEDLYSAIGGPSVLTCSESAPIITAAALFVPVPDNSKATGDRLSGQNWVVPATFGGVQQFPTAAGSPSFRFSSAWLSQGLPVLFGQDGDAVNVFKQFAGNANSGQGLSPFTTFDVNLQALDTLADGVNLAPDTDASVNELLLILQVQARPTGSMVDVPSCH